MFGEQLSRVIKTRNGEFPLGTLVLSHAGWISHYISPDGTKIFHFEFNFFLSKQICKIDKSR